MQLNEICTFDSYSWVQIPDYVIIRFLILTEILCTLNFLFFYCLNCNLPDPPDHNFMKNFNYLVGVTWNNSSTIQKKKKSIQVFINGIGNTKIFLRSSCFFASLNNKILSTFLYNILSDSHVSMNFIRCFDVHLQLVPDFLGFSKEDF